MSSFKEILKKLIFTILVVILSTNVFADNHDKDNSSKESKEEPLPLNDPFAGDDGTASSIVSDVTQEEELMNLSKYKLVGVFNGSFKSFATLVDDTGEFITLEVQEELSKGLKLVEVNIKEAIFQKGETNFISLNFKNQIIL